MSKFLDELVSIQKWPFSAISAPALPAQWNAFEVLIPSG
jgi:hypothetical protein